MLEPERTGHHRHRRDGQKPPWLMIAAIMVALAAVAALVVAILMKK